MEKDAKVIQYLREHSSPDAGEQFLAEWSLDGIQRVESRSACFACNTGIVRLVRLVNRRTGQFCVLGSDCYDEIRRRVQGLPSRPTRLGRSGVSALALVIDEHYEPFRSSRRIGSWARWLERELVAGRVPASLVAGVEELVSTGTINDIELLWKCIHFHDEHREESAPVLLGKARAARIFPHDYRRLISIRRAQDLLGLRPLSVEQVRAMAARVYAPPEVVSTSPKRISVRDLVFELATTPDEALVKRVCERVAKAEGYLRLSDFDPPTLIERSGGTAGRVMLALLALGRLRPRY